MIGLIYKDLCNLTRYIKQILVIVVAFTTLFAVQDGAHMAFLSCYSILLCSMIVISSMSYDDFAKWDKYALTMPISRKMLVGGKYLLGMLAILAGGLLSLVLFFTLGSFASYVQPTGEALFTLLVMSGIGLLFLAVLLPLLVKFGAEKARMMIMVPTVLVLIVSRLGITPPSPDLLERVLYASPVICAACFILSFFVSVSIANKKEY